MIRGLYTAASGMITQQRRHDAITNNISNLQTPGYKQETAAVRSFPELLIHLMENNGQGQPARSIGRLNTGVFVEENIPSFLQGDLSRTNQPGDLALISNIQVPGVAFDQNGQAVVDGEIVYQPQAFFTVQGADGEPRYTRDGRFHLDEAGQLVNVNGQPVLGVDGEPIVIEGLSMDQIYITDNGTLMNRADGTPLGQQLLISRIDQPNLLIRGGSGNYRLSPDAEPAVPIAAEDQVSVRQGYLERSNVDAAQSMVDMMTALRLYEANQRVIQSYDQILDKAVNQIGRIN